MNKLIQFLLLWMTAQWVGAQGFDPDADFMEQASGIRPQAKPPATSYYTVDAYALYRRGGSLQQIRKTAGMVAVTLDFYTNMSPTDLYGSASHILISVPDVSQIPLFLAIHTFEGTAYACASSNMKYMVSMNVVKGDMFVENWYTGDCFYLRIKHKEEAPARAEGVNPNRNSIQSLNSSSSIAQAISRVGANAPFQCTAMQFANTRRDRSVIDPFGATLTASRIVYLLPRIRIKGTKATSEEVKLNVKIVRPDGTLMRGDNSPQGYTYSYLINTPVNYREEWVELIGWGNESGGAFQAGEYRIELWHGEKTLANYRFTIH